MLKIDPRAMIDNKILEKFLLISRYKILKSKIKIRDKTKIKIPIMTSNIVRNVKIKSFSILKLEDIKKIPTLKIIPPKLNKTLEK